MGSAVAELNQPDQQVRAGRGAMAVKSTLRAAEPVGPGHTGWC